MNATKNEIKNVNQALTALLAEHPQGCKTCHAFGGRVVSVAATREDPGYVEWEVCDDCLEKNLNVNEELSEEDVDKLFETLSESPRYQRFLELKGELEMLNFELDREMEG